MVPVGLQRRIEDSERIEDLELEAEESHGSAAFPYLEEEVSSILHLLKGSLPCHTQPPAAAEVG